MYLVNTDDATYIYLDKSFQNITGWYRAQIYGHLNQTVSERNEHETNYESIEYATAATAFLVADDLTGVGFIDDVAIPFVWAAGLTGFALQNSGLYDFGEPFPKPWVYTKPDPTDPFWDPNSNYNFDPEWTIIGGSGGLALILLNALTDYQEYKQFAEKNAQDILNKQYAMPQDATRYFVPALRY